MQTAPEGGQSRDRKKNDVIDWLSSRNCLFTSVATCSQLARGQPHPEGDQSTIKASRAGLTPAGAASLSFGDWRVSEHFPEEHQADKSHIIASTLTLENGTLLSPSSIGPSLRLLDDCSRLHAERSAWRRRETSRARTTVAGF